MSDLEYFRDWYNNWLSTERMAEHYNMPRFELITRIKRGKEIHNSIAGSYTHPAPKEV